MSSMSESLAGNGASATREPGHSLWAPPQDELSLWPRATVDMFPREGERREGERPTVPTLFALPVCDIL